MKFLFRLFILTFSFGAWGQGGTTVILPEDIHGGSALCRQTRAEAPGPVCEPAAKQFSALRLQGNQWVRIASERDIKRKLFSRLAAAYRHDAEIIRQVGGADLFESRAVRDSLGAARAKCGAAAADGTLRNSFDDLIRNVRQTDETADVFAGLDSARKDTLLSRFALASLEIDRLSRLISDNHVSGPDLEQAQRRKVNLELRYPLAQSLSGSRLDQKFQIMEGVNNLALLRISPEEEAAVDVVLGLKDVSSYPDLEKFKSNRQLTLSGALAERIVAGKKLSPRLRSELVRKWENSFARKIQALGALCDVSHCQAYEVSHQLTADLVNEAPDGERAGLVTNICQCNLSNATEILSPGAKMGVGVAIIGGVTACISTTIACPALATIALVSTAMTAADSYGSLRDGLRGQEALALSRSLPGVPENERRRLEDFSMRSAVTGLAELALVAASSGAINMKAALNPIQATKIEIAAAQWQKEFLQKFPHYKDLPPSELQRIAREVSEKGEGFVKEVLRAGDVSVKSYVNSRGETVLKLSEPAEMAVLKGARTETVLAVDVKTGAIDVAFPGGQRLINAIFSNNEKGVIVVFMDLNHLGQTNYYYYGQAAGDMYLRAFGAAVRQNLRPGDLMLKTGGDEIVSIIPITTKAMENPETVKSISQRMVDTVHTSRDAHEVFKVQSRILANEFKAVARAEKLTDLPPTTRANLTPEQVELATANFQDFRAAFLNNQLRLLKDHARYQPSISIGSVIVRPGGSYEAAKPLAERQAAMVKVEYKAAGGATPEELAKYRIQVQTTKRRAGEIKPRPLDPIIMEPGNPGP